jgi:hypothetical protein
MGDARQHREIGALYDAAMGQRPWSEVGRSLMSAARGQTLILMVQQPLFEVSDLLDTQMLPEESLRTYAAHYAPQDVWIRGMETKRLLDRVVVGNELIDYAAFERTEFYCDFLKPRVPTYHIACSLLTLAGGRRAILGIHRARDDRAFADPDVRRLSNLLGHLRAALELRHRLGIAEATAASALAVLDRLSTGVLLVSSEGTLVHANRAGEGIVRAADGLSFGVAGLRARDRSEDRRLQSLISGAAATTSIAGGQRSAGGRVRISRPSGRRPYAVAVMPVSRNLPSPGKGKPAVIVFATDPASGPALDASGPEIQFGMPPAEARLAVALASGWSLPRYAAREGISYHTARTLLARALTRTGTESQLGLVRLVLGSLAGLAQQ